MTQALRADYVPGRIRPTMKAQLNSVDDTEVIFPNATVIYFNTEDGTMNLKSFTLTMDTGLRCIQAPCPSFVNVPFRVTKTSQPVPNVNEFHYQAVEVLKNIPINVKRAPRRLKVTVSDREVAGSINGQPFSHQTIVQVQLSTFPSLNQEYVLDQEYFGIAEHLASTM